MPPLQILGLVLFIMAVIAVIKEGFTLHHFSKAQRLRSKIQQIDYELSKSYKFGYLPKHIDELNTRKKQLEEELKKLN